MPWFIFLTEEIAAEGDYEQRLVSVQVAFSFSAFFFQVAVFHKEQIFGDALIKKKKKSKNMLQWFITMIDLSCFDVQI